MVSWLDCAGDRVNFFPPEEIQQATADLNTYLLKMRELFVSELVARGIPADIAELLAQEGDRNTVEVVKKMLTDFCTEVLQEITEKKPPLFPMLKKTEP